MRAKIAAPIHLLKMRDKVTRSHAGTASMHKGRELLCANVLSDHFSQGSRAVLDPAQLGLDVLPDLPKRLFGCMFQLMPRIRRDGFYLFCIIKETA